ncbi:DUF6221 family protein [Streptomyces bobili]|uniref:DUF6221 family protein n=1 Tax=Streptomyces bobili TaxID=67280 RepID=UPI0022594CF5|nr:DUF6221 family protein [Streptomyces bobili]MCX5522227.1 DUF6221 family protein [Streptomyces bobili]
MPDLHGWITQQIDGVELVARRATADLGTVLNQIEYQDDAVTADEQHIMDHDPAAVLRRCEADRRILNRHRLNPDAYWADAAMCEGCGTEGEMDYAVTDNLNDCPELLDLAYAHGITDDILATLDRPQEGERPEPGPGLGIPDVIAQSFASFWLGTRLVEPSPKEKAIKILGPELKKIPGYVPADQEQP